LPGYRPFYTETLAFSLPVIRKLGSLDGELFRSDLQISSPSLRVLDKIERQERSVEHIDVGTVNDWCFDWDWYYDAWPGELSLHEEWEEYRKQNK
jgi:hypothetical protein